MDMDKKKTLSVICPVYNEEGIIEVFYTTLKKVLDNISDTYTYSILFVMDPSGDDTSEKLSKIAANDKKVKVLKLSRRFGHQISLVAGIDNSSSDIIIMMDSDLQHPPELIPQMLSLYEAGNEVVYTIRKEPMDTSFLKRFCSRLFYVVMGKLSMIQLASGEADFRLISRRVALIFKNEIREHNQFLRGLFHWVGFKRDFIVYESVERSAGKSKYNYSRMMRLATDGIISFSKKPLQYAIMLGFILSLLGIFFAFIAIIEYFRNRHVPSGWTTLSVLICIFSGAQMLFLGIIGEYIGAIFDEVKNRPLYIIEERINYE